MTSVLYVEDHSFFANEICEYLKEDLNLKVYYAKSYSEAEEFIRKHKFFNFALLDVALSNGKTGVDIVHKFKMCFGRVMFITGLVDELVYTNIQNYASASKMAEIWPKLEAFFRGETPKIDVDDIPSFRFTNA